jgi:hypothetical protein
MSLQQFIDSSVCPALLIRKPTNYNSVRSNGKAQCLSLPEFLVTKYLVAILHYNVRTHSTGILT